MIERVIFEGKPNLSHFSDYFRYEMISKESLVWFDMDLIVLREMATLPKNNLVVKEIQGGINGALLYIDNTTTLKEITSRLTGKLDKNLRWGETGPRLLGEVFGQSGTADIVYGPEQFYPIEHYDIWKILLPEYADECSSLCVDAYTLHLFNNIIVSMAYWKDIAPPQGSFLYDRLSELEALHLFKHTYPESVMRQLIDNFRLRQNGKALGIRTLIRELLPSIRRSYRHYRK